MEGADDPVDAVKIPRVYGSGDLRKVGAGRKHLALVADHESDTFIFGATNRPGDQVKDVVVNCVHLGVEFQAENSVTQVIERCITVALHHFAAPLQDIQADLGRRQNQLAVRTFVQIPGELPVTFVLVERFHLLEESRDFNTIGLGAGDKSAHPQGVEHLERPQLPAEAPLHGIVHIDDVVGDLRYPPYAVDQGVAQVAPGEAGRGIIPAHNCLKALRRAPSLGCGH